MVAVFRFFMGFEKRFELFVVFVLVGDEFRFHLVFLIGLNVIKGLREMDLVFFLVKLCSFSYFVGVLI